MAPAPSRILSQPGVKRDGTRLEGEAYVDGLWMRFVRSLPRKMLGYRAVNKYLQGLVRTLHNYHQNNTNYLHAASANMVERLTVDNALTSSVISNRTPATLVTDPRNLWQFDNIFVPGEGLKVVAQVAPNLLCTCNDQGGQLFIGDALGTAPLTEIANDGTPPDPFPASYNLTGGIVVLAPFLVAFGTDGFVMWSAPGEPDNFTGSGAGFAYVTRQKIIRGMQLRGGPGASPSALLWSADSLLRMYYTGDATATFAFDTISAQISVLSSSCFVELDGIYYWLGTDRFLMFNGVVRDLENTFSRDFLFNNLNYSQRQKVFAFAIPRWGEIWWCFPFGDSLEPNHAVIYNTRENSWYDTPLPNTGRGTAAPPGVFRYPMLTGVDPGPTSTPSYRLWIHEIGVDEVDGLTVLPVRSFFETGDISLAASQQASNNALQVVMVEPDFVQRGPMKVQVKGRRNARAPEQDGPVMHFPDVAATPEDEVVFFKEQRRQLRFRFESNVVGGYYEMGQTYAQIQPGDGTVL